MTSNILKNGTDIDTLFLALEGTKRADVGIQKNGSDISNLFEPIGDGTAIANTGIQANGVDIATLFRDINEPVWAVSLSPGIFTHTPTSPPAISGIYIGSDGTIDEYAGGAFNYNQDWITPTSSASIGFDIQIVRDGGNKADFDSKPSGYNFGDWITVSAGRLFYIESTVQEDLKFITFTLSIRETGTTTVLASAGFNCTAHPTNL